MSELPGIPPRFALAWEGRAFAAFVALQFRVVTRMLATCESFRRRFIGAEGPGERHRGSYWPIAALVFGLFMAPQLAVGLVLRMVHTARLAVSCAAGMCALKECRDSAQVTREFLRHLERIERVLTLPLADDAVIERRLLAQAFHVGDQWRANAEALRSHVLDIPYGWLRDVPANHELN